MKRIILLFIIFTTLLTGCTQYKKLDIHTVYLKSFKFQGTSSASIIGVIKMDNPTKYSIELQDMEAELLKEGKVFATFDLVETSSIAPFTEDRVDVKVEAKVVDPLAIITTGLDFNKWTTEDFSINGKIVITSNGKSKKTIKLRNVPLDKVLSFIK